MLKSYFQNKIHEAGCDEVGRGCIDGPVVAGAVILPKDYKNNDIKDSKLISQKKRRLLDLEIKKNALAWSIGLVNNKQIDKINILNSSILAIQKAIDKVASIQGFGQNVTIRTITAGSYNTTTGVISESNSDATVKAVFEDVNMREVNELIQAEDKKITISAGDVTTKPTTKDKVLISSIVHNIIRVLTKTSGGTDISYTLYLRT